jgi:diguanylate cyclase
MIRPGDFVFRYGGEEFLAMLTHISEKQALEVAERMREKIEGHSLMLDEGCIQITASIGIAMYDGHPDYQRVINRADEAVYLAKDQGRNRSVMAA